MIRYDTKRYDTIRYDNGMQPPSFVLSSFVSIDRAEAFHLRALLRFLLKALSRAYLKLYLVYDLYT